MIFIIGATGNVGSELITASSPPKQARYGLSRAILTPLSPTASRRSWPISATAT